MSKELLELSKLYLQIAEEDLKKSTNKAVTELEKETDKESKEKKGIRIEREGGGYTMIYPGSPNYEKAKAGTLETVGQGESRGKVTNNDGKLTSKQEIKNDLPSDIDDEDAKRKARIKELETKLTNKENERKEKIENIGKTEVKPEDKVEVKPEDKVEVKPEDKVEVKPEDKVEVKPEDKVEVKPEVKKKRMNPIERRNREIFGDKKVDFLKTKQKDFKTMQALSQLPDAKPGEQKAIFAKKYPNSNVAKDLRASKRTTQWYDLESYDAKGQSLSEQGKKVGTVDAGSVPAEQPKALSNPAVKAGDAEKGRAKQAPKKEPKKSAAPNVEVNPEIKEASGCGSKKKKKKTYYEGLDAYDSVLAYLMSTNQVDTIEEANYVMMEMDGKTIYDIRQLTEGMPSYVRDSIGRQYGTGKYKGQKYTIEDKKNVINWYSGNIPRV